MAPPLPKLLILAPEDRGLNSFLQSFSHLYQVAHFTRLVDALVYLQSLDQSGTFLDVVVTKLGYSEDDNGLALVQAVRQRDEKTFICIYSQRASESASLRIDCFDRGASMVTHNSGDLQIAMQSIARINMNRTGSLICPVCGLHGLNDVDLFVHAPLYHVNARPRRATCPLCQNADEDFLKHLHLSHPFPADAVRALKPVSPLQRHYLDEVGGPPPMDQPVYLFAFALVVCRRPSDRKILLVQERGGEGFWLPGGHVEPMEDLQTAAIRETLEEGGILVDLKGILRVEYSPYPRYSRLRVIFYAEPRDDRMHPKTIPDYESCGAAWVSSDELKDTQHIRLRGAEPHQWATYLARGGQIFPLHVLTHEGAETR